MMKCTLDSPAESPSYYKLNKTDNTKITFDDYSPPGVFLNHFYTQTDAIERTDLSLTFRQVSSLQDDSFKFFALTQEPLVPNYEIGFLVFAFDGEGIRQDDPVNIICYSENVENVDESIGLAPVTFNCPLSDDIKNVEIITSKSIAGIPIDSTFLNPKYTDEAISNGEIKDKSTFDAPALLKIDENAINYDDASKELSILTFHWGIWIKKN